MQIEKQWNFQLCHGSKNGLTGGGNNADEEASLEMPRAEILRECSPPKHVTCLVSCVTCHVSSVTCHMSHVMCHMSLFYHLFISTFLDKVVKLIGRGAGINGAYPV